MYRLISLFVIAGLAGAQPRPQPPKIQDTIVSPEVLPDGKVIFRLFAPKASEAFLRGEWMEGATRVALARGSEDGIWATTIEGLEPNIYSYSFIVDGMSVSDPRNPRLKLGVRGYTSLVEIPGTPPQPWELQSVPHGTVHAHWYASTATNTTRRFHVYTPPGYEATKARHPVLYLLHGAGDTDYEWVDTGRANRIFDNLIAQGKAKPMIVVMPDGHAVPASAPPESRTRNTEVFGKDLIENVIPLVERTYRASPRREDRAIAGLSMGGGQSLEVGLGNLDRFSHIGVFSMGLRGDDFLKRHEKVFSKPEAANKQLKLFWIACGEKDFLWQAAEKLDSTLTAQKIQHTFKKTPGAHTWVVWRIYLSEFGTLLFR